MVTIKLKKPPAAPGPRRAPVRGAGAVARPRPTLAEAQAEREAARRQAAPAPVPPTKPAQPRRSAPPGGRRDTGRPDGPRRAADARGGPDLRSRPEPPRPREPHRGEPLRPRPDAPRRADPGPRAQPPHRPDVLHRDAARPPARPAPADARRRPFDRTPTAPRGTGPGPSRGRDDDEDDDFAPAPPEHAPGSVRLSKRMSELGIASRREADEWIAKGWVRVDDQIVSELGSRVLPGQRVTVDAKARYQQAQRVTVLVNKPVGYVSGQAEDGYEPAVVLVTPANQWREDRSGTRFLREHLKSLVPAGRLDIDSVGLLVLTQDGRVAKQLIGEESEVEKEYLVRVAPAADGSTGLSDAGLALLRHGLELDGEALLPATVEWVNADQLRFVLIQGRKRQIRRMCEAVGLQVLGLKRVRIGQVMLGDLPPGQWRYLRRDETFG